MEIIKAELSKNCKKLKGRYDSEKDCIIDSSGYFLIRINSDKNQIEAAFCSSRDLIDLIITGNTAEEIYNVFFNQGIRILSQHSAYLGKELEKAEIALKLGLEYVQDKPFNPN